MFQRQQLLHVSSIITVVVVVVRRRPQQGKGSIRHGTGCGCRRDRCRHAEHATGSEQSRGVILATSYSHTPNTRAERGPPRPIEGPEWCHGEQSVQGQDRMGSGHAGE